MKDRDILLTYLHDMEDFAIMKDISCSPIYLLGGSGCILGNYFDRSTTDFDLIDTGYPSSTGRLLKMLERFDLLDYFVTPLPPDYALRARKLEGFKKLEIYVLSPEDIIVSKLSRYSEKDIIDIKQLLILCDKNILSELIDKVALRNDFSERVKSIFIENSLKFKEAFDV